VAEAAFEADAAETGGDEGEVEGEGGDLGLVAAAPSIGSIKLAVCTRRSSSPGVARCSLGRAAAR
jgi:hypothetical protein